MATKCSPDIKYSEPDLSFPSLIELAFMRVLVIQHSAADSLAAAESVIAELGHEIITVRIDRQHPIPKSVDCDAMIMLGGPYPLTMENRPDWIANEQELVRRYVDGGRRILGICLGAQILASALGAPVRRNAQAELGWHTIRRTSDPSSLTDESLPSQMTVFQWHRDTFEIPNGAKHLYESDGCRNQAFSLSDRVYGFQFHLEADPRTIRAFLTVSKYRKLAGKGIQTEAEIMAGIERHLPGQRKHMSSFLAHLLPSAGTDPIHDS
jgi:GMP synthase-like glutamine amidotransferase